MLQYTIQTKQDSGKIKPLHGVNNGPVTYGALVDVSDHYIDMGIPFVRLHDPNWPHPREVDIHIIFPDFSKDPADPASYNFLQTDDYIRFVVETGAKINFRLGESIEHTERKYFVHPPESNEKWAQICLGIIRHYNEGWADGYHYNIEHWEIWNEPDYSVRMWSGTHEQYYRLYEVASKAIKAAYPHLKVGGPACARPTMAFVTEFLQHCRDTNAPLDFFSWHTYTADPDVIVRHAKHVREHLDEHGFTDTKIHYNEWNYFVADFATIWNKGNERMRKDTFDRQKGVEGSSFCAHVLSLLQDLPVDEANYYDGQPSALFCGLFDYHGVPQMPFYTFKAFNEMVRNYGTRLSVSASEEAKGASVLAGRNETGQVAMLVANFGEESRSMQFIVEGLEAGQTQQVSVHAIDKDHKLELTQNFNWNGTNYTLECSAYSVYYITIN